MCAARVLSDVVDRVTIVERDAYPLAHEFRAGVPQARHVHNLLARGFREFESFFPGFERRGIRLGRRDAVATRVESAQPHRTVATLREPCTHRRHRPRVVPGLKNVTLLERTAVTALQAAGGTQRHGREWRFSRATTESESPLEESELDQLHQNFRWPWWLWIQTFASCLLVEAYAKAGRPDKGLAVLAEI